jgi:hypothetical protein
MVPEGLCRIGVAGEHSGTQQQQRCLRVRRVGEQLAAVPRNPQRHGRLGAMRREIVERHQVAAAVERAHDAFGDRTGVERRGTVAPNRGERFAELGIAQHVAGAR